MNCEQLKEKALATLPILFSCQQETSRLQINTPYLYPDGDYIDLYVVETPLGLYFTDLGETMGYLADHGISLKQSPKRLKIVNDILLTQGIELFQGELRVALEDWDKAAWLVTRLGQGIVQICNLVFSVRLSTLTTFKSVPKRPWLVETLSSQSRSYANMLVSRVVRIWHDLRRVDGRYGYLALLDDSTDIWKPEWFDQMAELSEVVVWSQRERLPDLLGLPTR
jgi:hypothetical protein